MARSVARSRQAPARRRRVWARSRINQGGITSAGPQQIDLLGGLKLAGTGAMPLGWTVGPIILSAVAVRRTSAAVTVNEHVLAGVTVAPSSAEAVDMDPADFLQLDWMLFEAFQAPDGANQAQFAINPRSGTKAMRRLDEIDTNLWLVLGTNDTGTFTFTCYASVLVILP